MPDGILDEVAQDQLDRGSVAAYRRQAGLQRDIQAGALALGGDDASQHALEPRIQLYRLLGEPAATFNARELQRLVDLRLEAVCVDEQAIDELLRRLARGNGLALQPHAGQRRAQLVRERSEECLRAARTLHVAAVVPEQCGRQRQQQHEEGAGLPQQHALYFRQLLQRLGLRQPRGQRQLGDAP